MPNWDEVPDIPAKKLSWDDVPDLPQSPSVQRPVGAPVDFMSSVTPPQKTFEEEWREDKAKQTLWGKLKGVNEKVSQFTSRNPIDQIRTIARVAPEALRTYMEVPSRTAAGVAGSVAGLPSAFMKPKAARSYLRALEETTGLNPGTNAVSASQQERVAGDEAAGYAQMLGSLGGEVGLMALGSKLPYLNETMFSAPAVGMVESRGAETGASIENKLGGLAGSLALAKLMGKMPTSRITEGIAGVSSPGVATAASLPLSGAEGVALVALQNSILKGTVDQSQNIFEGAPEAFAMGVGARLGLGHLGTGGVEINKPPDTYNLSRTAPGEYRPDLSRNILETTSNPGAAFTFEGSPRAATAPRNPLMEIPDPAALGLNPEVRRAVLEQQTGVLEAKGIGKLERVWAARKDKLAKNPNDTRAQQKFAEADALLKAALRDNEPSRVVSSQEPSRAGDFSFNQSAQNPAEFNPATGLGVRNEFSNPYQASGSMYGSNPTMRPNEFAPDRSTDEGVWQNRSANLADGMGFSKGVSEGPYAEIPLGLRNKAGEYFEALTQLHQDPNYEPARQRLAELKGEAGKNEQLAKAISIVENMMGEFQTATKEAAPYKGITEETLDTWRENDPYRIPRKAVFTESKGDMPEFIRAGVLTPDSFKNRLIKWLVNDATGERQLIRLTDPKEGAPDGYSLKDATRKEIQEGTNITYLEDPAAALGRATGQLRSVKRVGEIKKFVDEQAARGNTKPQQIFEDAFGSGNRRDPNVVDNFNRTVTNVGFLNPFVHTPNQFSHFVKQLGIRSLLGGDDNAADLIRSMHEMANYGPEFREFLKNGGQSMRRNAYWDDLQKRKAEVLQSPELQAELKKEFGESTRFNKFIQDVTSMPTWLLDDAMRFSLTKKALKKHNGDWSAAIKDVDKSFPDYRLPTFATEGSGKGDRAIDAAYNTVFRMADSNNPVVRAAAPMFMKYRFGQWRSFMKMWGDAAKSVASGDKGKMAEVGDKLAAVMFTKMVLLPAASGVYNSVFGDEKRGAKVKARPGGHQHAMEQLGELGDAAAASYEAGDLDPFAKKAWQFGQQFAILNPLVRMTLTGGAGLDPYNMKYVPAGDRASSVLGSLPFGREVRSMREFGQSPGQALSGALLGKADKTDLDKYISTSSGFKTYETDPGTQRAKNELRTAIFDGDMAAAEKWADALGGADSKAVQEIIKYVKSNPEQRTYKRLMNLTANELVGAYGAAGSDDERNLVKAAIFKKSQESRMTPANTLKIKSFLARRGEPIPTAWLEARPWLNDPDAEE